jgi:hypothetical protein
MTAAHAVTAKYQSLNIAKKSGYSILADTARNHLYRRAADDSPIGSSRNGVAMGVHYVKGDLVKDPAIDAMHPEALVYAPDRHGGLHLAALEYVVIKSDWDAHNSLSGCAVVGRTRAAQPLRTRVQLHRRAQSIRPATVLFPARMGVEGQSCGRVRDVEPHVHCDEPERVTPRSIARATSTATPHY